VLAAGAGERGPGRPDRPRPGNVAVADNLDRGGRGRLDQFAGPTARVEPIST